MPRLSGGGDYKSVVPRGKKKKLLFLESAAETPRGSFQKGDR